jgi:hypothetical protein
MEARRLEPGDEEALKVFRRRWYAGQLHRETAEARGERMIAEELQRLGWSEKDLVMRRKNDPDKMAIAVRLRRETTLSIKAIAARVHLGTSNTANVR